MLSVLSILRFPLHHQVLRSPQECRPSRPSVPTPLQLPIRFVESKKLLLAAHATTLAVSSTTVAPTTKLYAPHMLILPLDQSILFSFRMASMNRTSDSEEASCAVTERLSAEAFRLVVVSTSISIRWAITRIYHATASNWK